MGEEEAKREWMEWDWEKERTPAIGTPLCYFCVCWRTQNSYANEDLPNSQVSSILEERRNNSSGALVAHLNINSIQNKFEELKLLNNELKAHIFIVSETN